MTIRKSKYENLFFMLDGEEVDGVINATVVLRSVGEDNTWMSAPITKGPIAVSDLEDQEYEGRLLTEDGIPHVVEIFLLEKLHPYRMRAMQNL